MMLECLPGVKLWSVKQQPISPDKEDADELSLTNKRCMTALGILQCSEEETYACAPPVLRHDTFKDLIIEQTRESPFELLKPTLNNACSYRINNYPTYTGVKPMKTNHKDSKRIHERYHFNKTYIQKITVNSKTFECKFEILFKAPRKEAECLECCSPWKGEVHNATISNLMFNH